MSVVVPCWNSAALVYAETSSVVSKTPKAPVPLACTLRSGTRSRLKGAICSMKCVSCSRIGPFDPRVSEFRSLGAGAPLPMVEPPCGRASGVVLNALSSWCAARSGVGRRSGARRTRGTCVAEPPEGHLGLLDDEARCAGVEVGGVEAGGGPGRAVDVHDGAAPAADEVVVVVAHAELVAGRGPGRLDAPDDATVGEGVQDVVDRLGRDLSHVGAHRGEHRVGARVR